MINQFIVAFGTDSVPLRLLAACLFNCSSCHVVGRTILLGRHTVFDSYIPFSHTNSCSYFYRTNHHFKKPKIHHCCCQIPEQSLYFIPCTKSNRKFQRFIFGCILVLQSFLIAFPFCNHFRLHRSVLCKAENVLRTFLPRRACLQSNNFLVYGCTSLARRARSYDIKIPQTRISTCLREKHSIFIKFANLADTLCKHSFCNFFKSCCIGSYYIVSFKTIFLSSVSHVMADIYHDTL